MDRAVFKVAEKMDALAQKFVFTKVNGAKDEGVKAFRETYGVIGFPTVLILKPDGTEVDRVVGFGGTGDDQQDADTFMKTMDAFAANEGTLLALQEELAVDPEDLDNQLAMATKRVKRYEFSAAKPHYEKILALDPDDAAGHGQEATFYVALANAQEGDVTGLAAFIDKTDNEAYRMTGSSALIRIYKKEKAFDKAIVLYETRLAASPENTDLMNEFAWMVYKEKLKDHYGRAIAVAAKAVELAPDEYNIWDTLAWLYAADGQKGQAIAAMEKAVALEPKFQEGLDKIKAGEM